MDNPTCPVCGSERTRPLGKISPDVKVQYYICDPCGHIWGTLMDGRDAHNVTPPLTPSVPT